MLCIMLIQLNKKVAGSIVYKNIIINIIFLDKMLDMELVPLYGISF